MLEVDKGRIVNTHFVVDPDAKLPYFKPMYPIASHPGLLRKIEKALTLDPHGTGSSVQIGDNTRVSPMEQLGFNSIPRRLEVDNTIYVIKTPKALLPGQTRNYQQPYISEMLQMASLETDLGLEYAKFGIQLHPPLLASGQLSIAEYLDGQNLFLADRLLR